MQQLVMMALSHPHQNGPQPGALPDSIHWNPREKVFAEANVRKGTGKPLILPS